MGVVKLCWNEFLSKANDKNVNYSGGGSNFFGMNLLVNLTKKVKQLMEVVRFHCNTLYFPGVFGNFGSL